MKIYVVQYWIPYDGTYGQKYFRDLQDAMIHWQHEISRQIGRPFSGTFEDYCKLKEDHKFFENWEIETIEVIE